MGLEMKKEKLCTQTVAEHSAECNIDTQINLPDYCGDIKRILKCNITPGVGSVNLSAGKVDVRGNATVRVVYVDEKDKIDCYETTESFNCACSIDYEKDDSVVNVLPEINYVNCRATGQRKMSVSSNIGLKISVRTQDDIEILTEAKGDGVQCKTDKVIADNLVCCARKVFEMSETAVLSDEKAPVGKVLWSNCYAVIDSKKAVSGKLLIKGELYTKLFYCTDEGSVEYFEHAMPISQILDVSGINEECNVSVTADVMQCVLGIKSDSSGENRLIEIAVKISCPVKGTKRENYSIIDECYCTGYDVETFCRNDEFSRLVHSADRQITVKKNVDMPTQVKKVYSVWACDVKSSMDGTGNKASGKADVTLGIIYADEKNSISYIEKSVELDFEETLNESYDRLICCCDLCVRDIKFTCEQKDKINLTLQTGFIADIYNKCEKKHLTKIEIKEDSPKKPVEAAIVIYFADKNEKIWDIARKYNTTTDAIMQENEIDCEILGEDRMLMIPCG